MAERPHQRLFVWQKSMQLVQLIYTTTGVFPKQEQYALTSQMRRAVVSIPSNIAEGAARWSNNEKVQFFRIARGSLSELETQLEISKMLQYATPETIHSCLLLTNDVGRLLNGLLLSREQNSKP